MIHEIFFLMFNIRVQNITVYVLNIMVVNKLDLPLRLLIGLNYTLLLDQILTGELSFIVGHSH